MATRRRREPGPKAEPLRVEKGDGAATVWVPIRHAADLANVSVDTIRRRIKMEQIPWRRDLRGRYMVTLPAGSVLSTRPALSHEATASLLFRLRNCAALLTEIRAQRDQLQRQLEVQQRLLEAHAEAEADLRRLLAAERSAPSS